MLVGAVLGIAAQVWASSPDLDAEDRGFLEWSDTHFREGPRPDTAAGYRYSGDVFREVGAALRRRPGVVEPERIGESVGDRPIWAFHIEDPAREADRSVLVFAGIHALEWISTEVATDLLLELIDHPPAGVRVTVVPLLNPDGRSAVQKDLDAGRVRYRRSNRAGVDLNRDFDWNRKATSAWRHLLPAYHGTSPAALSQPESRAIDALCAREGYDRAASLHAFGGFFYYPWAGRWVKPDARDRFVELAEVMEDAQGARAYHGRQLARWGFFFRAQGTELDHLYGAYGIEAFLIELTRSGLHPFSPQTWKTYFRWYNPKDPERHKDQGVRALRALIWYEA